MSELYKCLITGYQGQPDLNQRLDFAEKKSEADGSYGKRQLDVVTGHERFQ